MYLGCKVNQLARVLPTRCVLRKSSPNWGAGNRGSCRRLPLRDGLIDWVVSDLPFGINCGSMRHNPKLYQGSLRELARVCVLGAGIALLVQNKKPLLAAIDAVKTLELIKIHTVNIGGLVCYILLLKRSLTADPVMRKRKAQSKTHTTEDAEQSLKAK